MRNLELLNGPIANIVAVKSKFRGACFASADHGFIAVKLSPRNQANSPAPRTREHGHEGIAAFSQRGRSFEKKDRSRFHFFGDPCFEELQLSCHSSLRWVSSTGLRLKCKPLPRWFAASRE